MANGEGREGMYGTIVKWKYFPRKGKRAAVITVVEYNETGRNRCLDGAIDVTFPIASFPSSSFSSFMLSNFSLSLSLLSRSRRIHHSRINSIYSSGSLKKQKKRKAWLRGRLKIKTAILFARWIYFFSIGSNYTRVHPISRFDSSPTLFFFSFFPPPSLSPSAIFRVKMENNMGTINARFDKLSPLKRETGERATHSIPACIHRWCGNLEMHFVAHFVIQ